MPILINNMQRKIVPVPLTLKSLINNSVESFADRPSVSFVNGSPITYRELGKEMDALALLLFSFGLQKGDKVALFSHNMPNWVVAYFAIVSKGLIVVPILPDFTQSEVESILKHSESKVLLVSERLVEKVKGLDLPDIKATILVNNMSVIDGEKGESISLEEINKIEVGEEDLAAIIYTSGTTGRSKGVMLTHKNITFVVMQSYTVQVITDKDVFLSFLPLSHTYENSIGMLYPIMYGSSIYYLEKPPTAASLLPALAKIKPTMMLSVPLIMEKLYKTQVYSKFKASRLKFLAYKTPFLRKMIHRIAGKKLNQTFGGRLQFFGIGGAKLDFYVERFLKEARFPYAIGYGLTESAPLLAAASPSQTYLQSVGYALEGVELKIHEPDNDGVGELWAKAPNVMRGYYKNQEATDEVLTADGWLKTGDLAQFDSQKRIFIKGRMKSTIIGSSGENIYPEDIESVINNNEFVAESLVVEEDGSLVAKVLLNDGIFEKYKDRFTEWKKNFTKELNSKLNRISQIKRVDIMEEPFVKTASQKIKRFLYTKNDTKNKNK